MIRQTRITRKVTVTDDVAIKSRILRILKAFDDFSKRNSIQYYALGGTLLGAIRHGGFIPWDDDIDIGIPRDDYDRLMTIAWKLPPPYRLESIELYPDFVYPFTKLYDTSTTVTEDLASPLKRGLWIDIFPLDGSFKNKYIRKLHCKAIDYLKRKVIINRRSYLADEHYMDRTTIQKLVTTAWQLVPKRPLHSLLQRLLKLKDFNRSSFTGNLLGSWGGDREVMDAIIISKPSRVLFCNIEIPAPSQPDAYLRSIYGDYMKLPAAEARVSSHRFLEINLNKPYIQSIDRSVPS